jgi:hypothetical protein
LAQFIDTSPERSAARAQQGLRDRRGKPTQMVAGDPEAGPIEYHFTWADAKETPLSAPELEGPTIEAEPENTEDGGNVIVWGGKK